MDRDERGRGYEVREERYGDRDEMLRGIEGMRELGWDVQVAGPVEEGERLVYRAVYARDLGRPPGNTPPSADS